MLSSGTIIHKVSSKSLIFDQVPMIIKSDLKTFNDNLLSAIHIMTFSISSTSSFCSSEILKEDVTICILSADINRVACLSTIEANHWCESRTKVGPSMNPEAHQN